MCKICGQASPSFHRPEKTIRGLVVSRCEACGFVQGNLETESAKKGEVAPRNYLSCDGDYASVRVGKAQMLSSHREFLQAHLKEIPDRSSILDVAAARGDFAEFLLSEFPDFKVRLEEHSPQMFGDLLQKMGRHKNMTVSMATGSSGYPSNAFDFIYATHSLEHFRNPREVMERWTHALKESGTLFLDVPDVTKIDLSSVVDDHFYDEHLSYFSQAHLEKLGSLVGLRVSDSRQLGGSVTVTMVHDKHLSIDEPAPPLFTGLTVTKFLEAYNKNLVQNRNGLSSKVMSLASRISRHSGSAIAIGCGRKFDAYRVYGAMDIELFDYFFDTYMSRAFSNFHGRPIFSLDAISEVPLDNPIFVVFGSSSLEAMTRLLVNSGFHQDQVIAV